MSTELLSIGLDCCKPLMDHAVAAQNRSMGKVIYPTQGEKIRVECARRQWNGAALAEHVGVSQTAANTYLRGEALPGLEKFHRMCQVFGVSMDYLWDERIPVGQYDARPDLPTLAKGKPGIVRELAPGPPRRLTRKANAKNKGADPPAAGAAKAGGPRSPRAGGSHADVEAD